MFTGLSTAQNMNTCDRSTPSFPNAKRESVASTGKQFAVDQERDDDGLAEAPLLLFEVLLNSRPHSIWPLRDPVEFSVSPLRELRRVCE